MYESLIIYLSLVIKDLEQEMKELDIESDIREEPTYFNLQGKIEAYTDALQQIRAARKQEIGE